MSSGFEIVVDPSARLKSSYSERSSVASELKKAAVAIGSLASPAYEKLAKFQTDGTESFEFGSRAGKQTAGAKMSAHFSNVTSGITKGIRESLVRTQDGLDLARGAMSGSMLSAKNTVSSAKTKIGAIRAFVEAARSDPATPEMIRLSTTSVKEMSSRLHGFSKSLSSGILSALSMGTAALKISGEKIARFLDDGSTTIFIGATETIRKVAQNRHLKLAGYAVAIGGLGLFGLHSMGGAEMLTKGLGFMGGHLNMPELADIGTKIVSASDVATQALSGGLAHQQPGLAASEAIYHVHQHIGGVAGDYWHNVGQIAGRSGAGHDLIRAASYEHLQTTASTFAQTVSQPTGALNKIMSNPLDMTNAHAAMFGHHAGAAHDVAQHGSGTAGHGRHHGPSRHVGAPVNDPPGAADQLMKQELSFLHSGGHPNPTDGNAPWLKLAQSQNNHLHKFTTVSQATARTAASLSSALPPPPHVGTEDMTNLCRVGPYTGMVMPKCT